MDKTMKKLAMLHKMAESGFGDMAVAAAAAVVAASFITGLGAGAFTGKVTEPADEDFQNMEKEQELARLHRDNQTQKILAAREEAERRMRNKTRKAMRY